MSAPIDWDDIRFLLALVRQGSVRAAAKELQVNHSTVTRRLKRMERRLGSRLVQRTPEGYQPTDSGERVLAAGQRIETDLSLVIKQVEGSDLEVRGRVGITLTDIILELARPVLADLLDTQPGLELDLTTGPMMTDIMRLHSDIALRLVSNPPEDLVGRRIASIPAAVYGPRGKRLSRKTFDPATARWVRWRAPWDQVKLDSWVEDAYPHSQTGARVDSYFALESMVASGAGVGILTPLSADRRKDVVRLSDDIEELALDLWLLTHPDSRGVRRVKTVADALAAFFATIHQTP